MITSLVLNISKKLIVLKLGEAFFWLTGATAGFLGLKNAIQGAADIAEEANEQFEQMSLASSAISAAP